MNTTINKPAFDAARNATLANLTPLETALVSGGETQVGWRVEPAASSTAPSNLTPLETALVSGGENPTGWRVETVGNSVTP